ncbi:hypothetical protein [Streptomyces sp. NRRL WC-3549]|uniref:hypothetical protein n=1 Tax=Streptomyces sp. NRRL WC-3549 TaxID=1463925 RepID=UPI000AC24584|nr:hypothetical protein [Streptomyces sp. NRRL WC-3549]
MRACDATTPRIADCSGSLYIDPRYGLRSNSDATSWKIGALTQLWKPSGGLRTEQAVTVSGTVKVKRWAKATVNASPEPVKKGQTLTVTGSFKRADWAKYTYTGFAGASVKLQFRKKAAPPTPPSRR